MFADFKSTHGRKSGPSPQFDEGLVIKAIVVGLGGSWVDVKRRVERFCVVVRDELIGLLPENEINESMVCWFNIWSMIMLIPENNFLGMNFLHLNKDQVS